MLRNPRTSLKHYLGEKQAAAEQLASSEGRAETPLSEDERVEQFIATHPQLCARLQTLTKAELVRELVARTLMTQGHRSARLQEVLTWVEAKPGRHEEIAGQIADQRWRNKFNAFVSAAERAYCEQVESVRIRPR